MLNSLAFGLEQELLQSSVQQQKILDLGIGQPLLSKLPKEIYNNFNSVQDINKYYPASGDKELRSLILKRYYPSLSLDNIAITNGAIGGLDFVFRALKESEAKILLPNPGFSPYEKLAQFSGYKVNKYTINYKNNDSLIDWASLTKNIDHETKILLLNSPHNPTGKVLKQEDFFKLIDLLVSYPKLNLIMDEVYRDLIFGSQQHIDFVPLLDRTYIIGSFSKVFPIQGARIGWVTTSRSNQLVLEPYFQNTLGSVSSYGQELAKNILKLKLSFFDIYAESKDKTISLLKKLNIPFIQPEGSFYVFINVGSDDQLVKLKLENQKVKVLSGSDFGDHGANHIRVSFAQDFETIKAALHIIGKVIPTQSRTLS